MADIVSNETDRSARVTAIPVAARPSPARSARTAGAPARPSSARAAALRQFVRRLSEDVTRGSHILYFSTLGSSVLTPRTLRRLLYSLAGASVQSAPGIRMRFRGSAKNLTIGFATGIGWDVYIDAVGPVTIGNECGISAESMILTAHHPVGPDGHWSDRAVGRPVTIGDHVFLGSRADVLPGVTIESNVIVAAGAVVTRRCLAGGVYAGVPARRIKECLPSQQAEHHDVTEMTTPHGPVEGD
jgi:maltose O-acetyltransferase